jgi:hypothetical protein
VRNDPVRRFSIVLVPVFALVFAGFAGCDGPKIPLYPASGLIRVDGQPTAGVEIRLHPPDSAGNLDATRPFATSDEGGRFTIGTFEKEDGAPEGTYKVTLFWPDHPPGPSPAADLLAGRYSDPNQTPLEVIIKPTDNALEPIDVEKPDRPPASRRKIPARSTSKPDLDGVN